MDFRKIIETVLCWYESDEQQPRSDEDILRDIVEDLQRDRTHALSFCQMRVSYSSHQIHMKDSIPDVRDEDRQQHELNSLRGVMVGLREMADTKEPQ